MIPRLDATRIVQPERIERASKTLDQVQGAWGKEEKVKVGKIATVRVAMRVTFLLKE